MAAALLTAGTAQGATFTVINTNAAGDGSLYQAIVDANASAGADLIDFNIPSGGLTIRPTNALPVITEPVTIDGATQTGYAGAPVIELQGTSAGATVDGLKVATSNSVIRALVINRFAGDGIEITNGANNTIEGCYLGLNLAGSTDQGNTLNGILITNAANNIIGGVTAASRNYIAGNNQSGINLSGALATNNVILGNVIGLNSAGTAVANSADGVRVNAPDNLLGGSASGAGNVISGNTGQGIEVTAQGTGTAVQGNYIGTDATGTLDRGNTIDGILVYAGGVLIGGANAGEGNRICGNAGDGIEFNGAAASNNGVLGNTIGIASGLRNDGNGVLITGSSHDNVVGGLLPGEPNTIAYNGLAGISVAAEVPNTNNTFRVNALHSNTGLGIDLGATGVTVNDANDVDTGANRLQNFPVLTAATNTGGNTIIVGSLHSTASTLFAIDFYANLLFDPASHGEGEFHLGSTTVTTDASGDADFMVTLPVALPGRYVCATATDPDGNTSEFGPVVAARGTAVPATFTVVNTADSGPGSLRQAILDANASITEGSDLIRFEIPGDGPHVIAPLSALPPVADPVIIDGYTQSGASPNTLSSGDNAVLKIRLDGNSAPNNVSGLTLWGGHSTVRGLAITRFKSASGHGLSVVSDHNVIEGNFLGLSTDGVTDQGNVGSGISVRGANNRIGGPPPAARNLIGGNANNGIEVTAQGTGTVVQGNYLGTDATGTLDRGNDDNGILVYAGGVLIGGANAGEGNLIGGNAGDGLVFNGASATACVVLGNTIGVSSGLRNDGNGVLITSGSHNNVIGGLLPGEPNTIACNGSAGISVAAAAANTNNTFRVNAIHSNGGLGIDLGTAGVTVNDANDVDSGANRLQNFPMLSAATNTGSGAIIMGSLHSTANTLFAIDFYANLLFDPTSHGEGEFYLGSTSVTTDAGGNASFSVTFPVGLPGRYVCATATDPNGNTSEFGPVLAAQANAAPATFTVVNTNDSGPGSLRQAILDANAVITEGSDLIRFEIPGDGPHVIAPLTALPPVADAAVIDGYTQSGASPNTLSSGDNAMLKIQLDGNSAPNNVSGLTLWGGHSTVRGLAITRFKSASGHGLEIYSDHNVIEGNFIGVGTDGVTDLGNGGNGISVSGANNRIGGPTPAARNLISGNAGDGIELNGAAVNNAVLGNTIGIAAGLRNDANGVLITGGSHDNVIGGLLPGEPNTIAYNGSAGISVAAAAANTNNLLRGNSIHSNADLGIDLGATGVTVNDANDADTGANRLQNFPVLVSVTTNSPTQVSIAGSLSSAATTTYAVDFYANTSLDTSGHGEGQFHLGSATLATDGSGQADFAVDLPVALPGRFVSATATDPAGNTSEFSRWRIATSSRPPTNVNMLAADFVFIVDASSSMGDNIAAVKAGLGSFVTGLNTAEIDARFAIVLFGGPSEVILDFTSDQLVTESAFDLISVSGAVPGVHVNHNLNPEAGLEAIRIVLNSATNNTLLRNNVGGIGPLAFRADARKNLILVTDENSDLPYYTENRQPGQSGTDPPTPLNAAWQAEVDATAQAVIAHSAFLNVLINPSGVIRNQYGDPAQSASDANFLNFDPGATLTNLITAGFGGSLEAQVLAGGLIGRAFNITAVNTANFIENFFAAKVKEIIENPLPPPRLYIVALPDESAVRLTWTTNSPGFLLETNHVLTLTNGWGVLTTNYSVINTNYAVTNLTSDPLRFYRLHKR